MRVNCALVYERSTKNKHVFKEVSDNPIIESLYVRKEAFGDEQPDRLAVQLITPNEEKS